MTCHEANAQARLEGSRRVRLAFLIAVMLLAGCAGAPPQASVEREPSAPAPHAAPPDHEVRFVELANATVSLLAEPFTIKTQVPAGALSVAYYLTLVEGASVSLRGDYEGCVREERALTPGYTMGMDCGSISEGERALTVSHAGGRATVHVLVNATVRPCAAASPPCPGAPGVRPAGGELSHS